MEPEVILYYSEYAFGTADAISFEKQILRIHDLKTGIHPGHFEQLEIYCVFFCLEYGVNPYDIEMILRIYQSDDVLEMKGDPKRIRELMDKLREFDQIRRDMAEVMGS